MTTAINNVINVLAAGHAVRMHHAARLLNYYALEQNLTAPGLLFVSSKFGHKAL